MDHGTNQILFALLRSAVCGEPLSGAERALFSEAQLPALLETAKKHDMIHLLALGLKRNALALEKQTEIGRHILLAVYRQEQQSAELETLCRTLEAAGIPFLPLKGAVLRGYYPEAWMRTSCDLDILVKEQDAERAAAVLVSAGFVRGGKGTHDISLFAPNKTHVELHYKLVEDGLANSAAQVLEHVWEAACVRENCNCWHEMPDEVFYFYHVAHMAKHFEQGGCGIRPLMDLWILDGLPDVDSDRRDALLARGDLLKFAQVVRRLSGIWFGGAEHVELTKQMEEYILNGGVYGSSENGITLQQQKKGGRLKYLWSRIFMPYEKIKYRYPILQKCRWLTPIMEVRRWFRLIFLGRVRRRVTREIQYNGSISSEEAVAMQTFLNDIGLQSK